MLWGGGHATAGPATLLGNYVEGEILAGSAWQLLQELAALFPEGMDQPHLGLHRPCGDLGRHGRRAQVSESCGNESEKMPPYFGISCTVGPRGLVSWQEVQEDGPQAVRSSKFWKAVLNKPPNLGRRKPRASPKRTGIVAPSEASLW